MGVELVEDGADATVAVFGCADLKGEKEGELGGWLGGGDFGGRGLTVGILDGAVVEEDANNWHVIEHEGHVQCREVMAVQAGEMLDEWLEVEVKKKIAKNVK